MGWKFPINPPQDGDDEALSPSTNSRSLLGADPVTGATRRIMVSSGGLLQVGVGANNALPAGVDTLATGSQSSIAANLLTTIVTYTAPADKAITKISVSGTEYAKFQLFKNTALIDTKRTGPDRSTEFVFINPLNMNSGDILDVKVTHFVTTNTIDAEASIYGA